MRTAMRRGLQRQLRRVLHTADSPRRTAAAFALGVFIGCSPFLGIHTLAALALGFLLRLNRPAVVLGTLVLNPWTLLPVYGTGTAVGFLLLGAPPRPLPPELLAGVDALHPATVVATLRGLGPYLGPFVVGNLVLAGILGTATYPLARLAVSRLRAARARRRAARGAARAGGPAVAGLELRAPDGR